MFIAVAQGGCCHEWLANGSVAFLIYYEITFYIMHVMCDAIFSPSHCVSFLWIIVINCFFFFTAPIFPIWTGHMIQPNLQIASPDSPKDQAALLGRRRSQVPVAAFQWFRGLRFGRQSRHRTIGSQEWGSLMRCRCSISASSAHMSVKSIFLPHGRQDSKWPVDVLWGRAQEVFLRGKVFIWQRVFAKKAFLTSKLRCIYYFISLRFLLEVSFSWQMVFNGIFIWFRFMCKRF